MADVALPAPGGSVGLKTFAIYLIGGAIANEIYDKMPKPNFAGREFFGVTVDELLNIAAVLAGAGLLAKIVNK
jgi:hypothetical protein